MSPPRKVNAPTTCESRQGWLDTVSGHPDSSAIRSGLWSIAERTKTSASRLTRQDYLCLRVLWPARAQPRALRRSGIFSKEQLADADARLSSFSAYQAWIRHLVACHGNFSKLIDENNSFLAVQAYMRAILETDTEVPVDHQELAILLHDPPLKYRTRHGRESLETIKAEQLVAQLQHSLDINDAAAIEDEMRQLEKQATDAVLVPQPLQMQPPQYYSIGSMVSQQSSITPEAYPQTHSEYVTNCALLLFLQTLTIGDPKVTSKWTADRASLKIFGAFTALTDGFLQRPDDVPAALVECKPYVRQRDKAKIRYQESAQMAAYIHNFPDAECGDLADQLSRKDGKRRRFSIAQNHCEIYIIIAEFTDKYADFVQRSVLQDWEYTKQDRVIDDESFLVQRTYGPFLIHEPAQLHELAAMVVALSRMQST